MLNGILTYYELTITSEADGSQQTWRIQHNHSTEVNVTGLGETNVIIVYIEWTSPSIKCTDAQYVYIAVFKVWFIACRLSAKGYVPVMYFICKLIF